MSDILRHTIGNNVFMIATLKSKFNRKRLKKIIFELLVVMLIVIAVQMWRSKDMLETDGSITVEPVTTVSLQGETLTLFEQPQNTLIYFFAPWCQVCAWSIGSLEAIDKNNTNIVVIAMDYGSVEAVQRFVQEHNVKLPIALGNRAVAQQFSIRGYPSYYLLNENNQVVAKYFGLTTSTQIKLQQWLAMQG